MIAYKLGEHVIFTFTKNDDAIKEIIINKKKPITYKRVIIEKGETKIVT